MGAEFQSKASPRVSLIRRLFIGLFRWIISGLAVATALAGLASVHWMADQLVHFRVQYCVLLLASVVAMLSVRQWIWCGVALLCLAINAVPVAPYFMPTIRAELTTEAGTSSPRVWRLLCQNVLTSNEQVNWVEALIREQDPDVVILMETNERWERELSGLSERYPSQRFVHSRGNFGIAILSKQAWRSLEVVRVEPLKLPSLILKYDLGAGTAEPTTLQIVATHPIPPMDERRTQNRNDQLTELALRVERDAPAILAGDLNLTPWSPQFQRVLNAGGLTDAALGFGVSPSWHVLPTFLGGIKIDHVLINRLVRPLDYKVLRPVGSDHRGVLLEFSADPDSRKSHSGAAESR